jgi:hypothetical protein
MIATWEKRTGSIGNSVGHTINGSACLYILCMRTKRARPYCTATKDQNRPVNIFVIKA